MKQAPFPRNEMDRIMALADMNIDYGSLTEQFKDLAKLAAKVSGSPISLINLIDNYTTWTISSFGLDILQTPREESICQYAILEKDHYEVNDLSQNPIFQNEEFVTGDMSLRFYYGVPLAAEELNLGTLCVIDHTSKSLSAEKTELLKIIAGEIINRLKMFHYIETLRNRITEVKQTQNKVVHDIRGPLAGIMTLTEIISMQGKENNLDEVLDFIGMIHKGGKSILDLADDILSEENRARNKVALKPNEMTLHTFKDRLEQLYTPQAKSKNIELKINIPNVHAHAAFPQNKLMQIAGNLISNAIKFTPKFGDVTVTLDVEEKETGNTLKIAVKDTGAGITKEHIEQLLADNTESADGTDGEKGYGFGLALVKHLVKGLDGTFSITSEEQKGSQFEVTLPFKQ